MPKQIAPPFWANHYHIIEGLMFLLSFLAKCVWIRFLWPALANVAPLAYAFSISIIEEYANFAMGRIHKKKVSDSRTPDTLIEKYPFARYRLLIFINPWLLSLTLLIFFPCSILNIGNLYKFLLMGLIFLMGLCRIFFATRWKEIVFGESITRTTSVSGIRLYDILWQSVFLFLFFGLWIVLGVLIHYILCIVTQNMTVSEYRKAYMIRVASCCLPILPVSIFAPTMANAVKQLVASWRDVKKVKINDNLLYGITSLVLVPCFVFLGIHLDDDMSAPNSTHQLASDETYSVLQVSTDEMKNFSPSEVASRKNQLMDDLLAREDIPEGYAAAMEALYRDRSNDNILRGFAVQHFPLHAETLARRGQFDVSSPEAARVRETLFDAARETSSSVGGTALLALERLSHTDSSVDCDALAALVLRTAADDSADPATRLAAVQLCGTLRLPAAAPYLRTLSADDSANTALRLAARHSLSAIESATMSPE